jgi:hypothetical protein
VIPFLFIILFLLLTLNRTQMTSHGSSDEGNAQSHTDGLAREGFPRILWEVLQGAGYTTPPQYAVVGVVLRCAEGLTRRSSFG